MSSNLIKLRSDDGTVRLMDEENNIVHVNGKSYEMREMSLSDVHVDGALTNFVTGYGTNLTEAIADFVCPPLPVQKMSDYYHTFSSHNKHRRVTDEMAGEDSALNEVSPEKSTDTYSCKPYGISSFVSQGSEANADAGVNPRLAAVQRCMNVVTLMHEDRVVAALQSAATFAGYTAAIAAGAKWNDGATSNPIKDITAGIMVALKPINLIAMSERTYFAFIQNPNVTKHFSYSGAASIGSDPNAVARLLGLPPFVIGRMKGESLTTGTPGYLWGNHVCLLHVPAGSTTNGENVPTSRTFRWLKGGASAAFRLRNWIEPARGQDGGERVAVCYNEHVKVVAAATGYLLTDAYQ
ncbi:MAG: hypothetical protein WC563_15555 [Brevundimonas sp.]